MTLRPLFALFAAGLCPLLAEVPVDYPVASIRTGQGATLAGVETGALTFKPSMTAELWRQEFTPGQSLPAPRITPLPEGFGTWYAGHGKALLAEVPHMSLESLRVIDTGDGSERGSLDVTEWLFFSEPQITPQGAIAMGRSGAGAGYRLVTYDRDDTLPVLRAIPAVSGLQLSDGLLGATGEWFAMWGTEPQIGDKAIVVMRASDLTEIRRVTIPWQWGLTSLGSAHGNRLYFKTTNRLRCLDIATGELTESLDLDSSGVGRQFEGLAADDQGFWIYSSAAKELRRYTGDPAAGHELVFRGQNEDGTGSQYTKLHVAGGRAFVQQFREVRVFDPALSRPRASLPGIPRLREADAEYPLTIALDRAASREVSFRVRSNGGSATPGVDFDAIDTRVRFPAGSRSAVVPVRLRADQVAESNETVVLEFSEPDGIALPPPARTGLVIVASGMEWREIPLQPVGGVPMPWGGIQVVFDDVLVGKQGGDPTAHLWDRHTGAHRGITGIPVDTRAIVETPAGLEAASLSLGQLTLIRVNPANGATLRQRSFTIPSWSHQRLPLGGGRVMVTYSGGSSDTLAAKIYSFDGPEEGENFPLFNGKHPGGFEAIADARYLVIGWSTNDVLSSMNPASRGWLRWYSSDTLEVVGEMATEDILEGTPAPLAMRGNLLFCANGGVTALDLETREVVWRQPGAGAGVFGRDHWIGGGKVWEIATGMAVEENVDFTPRMPGGDYVFPSSHFGYGPGGLVLAKEDLAGVELGGVVRRFRVFDYRGDRQAPLLEILAEGMQPDHEGSHFALRLAEPVAASISARLSRIEPPANPANPLEPVIDASPVAVPGDGGIARVPYLARPDSWALPGLGVEVRVGSTIRHTGLNRSNAPVRVAEHLVEALPAGDPADYSTGFRMTVSDGRLLVCTGEAGAGPGIDSRVDVIDPATGALVMRLRDPSPRTARSFALNAICQGDKLLVIAQDSYTFTRTGEIYRIPTGERLGTVSDRVSGVAFGEHLASNGTFFAMGAPSTQKYEKKSRVLAWQWSDFRRVLQASGKNTSGLGDGVTFFGNNLYAGIAGPNGIKPGLLLKGLAKSKAPKAPKGLGGRIIADDDHLILHGTHETRAFHPATFKPVWSAPLSGIYEAYANWMGTSGDLMWVRGERDVSLLDKATGKPLATGRISGDEDRPYSSLFGCIMSHGKIFCRHRGRLISLSPHDLGDFADTRRLRGLNPRLNHLAEDLDASGTPDFQEYLERRLPPGRTFGSARIGSGALIITADALPPPDLVSLVEVEIAPGWWSAVAWRDGLGAWTNRTLPEGVSEDTPLRMRHLPHPSLGWFPSLLSWPPLAVAIPDDGANALPDPDAVLAAANVTGDATDGWVSDDDQPLRLVNSGNGWGVEYVRPAGEANPAIAEFSHDLILWLPVKEEDSLSTTAEPAGDGLEKVTIRPAAEAERLFFRLRYPE